MPAAALLFVIGCGQADRLRNVILFFGGAGGILTLHAAGIHGHGSGQALFIHQMTNIASIDTARSIDGSLILSPGADFVTA